MNKSLFKITSIILPILPILPFLLLNTPTSALTYQTTTDVEFTVNPSINVSLSSNDLLISDLTPGTSSDSNIITVNVSTNAGYGYYLAATAGASSGSTNLVNTVDSSRVFTNLSSNKASLSNFSDNTWGYSYSTDNGTNWISGNNDAATAGYNGLPLDNNDNGATGIQLASTDSYVSTNSIKFKIGAKASTTQSGGTYTNTVNFYAVANPEPTLGPVACEAGKICYNVNTFDPTEGTMGKQVFAEDGSYITNGSTVTLLASNFSREGYGFAGWNTSYDYTGTNYGPNESIITPTDTSINGLSLYAVWVPSVGNLQDWTCPSSASMPIGAVVALTDQRDGETYAVAKLADGKCWMIENLRLDNTATANTSGTSAQGYGGQFAGLADPEAMSLFDYATTANTLYSTDGANNTIGIGTSNASYRFPRYNNVNTPASALDRPQDPTANHSVNMISNASMYSYGNYYTWPAAIADTTYYITNNQSIVSTSICPSGWHLPRSGDKTNESNNEFWALIVTGINNGIKPANYDGSIQPYYAGSSEGLNASRALRAYPNNFIYSSSINGGSSALRGSTGAYWSSTVYRGSNAYLFSFGVTDVMPVADANKYQGVTIRCVMSST